MKLKTCPNPMSAESPATLWRSLDHHEFTDDKVNARTSGRLTIRRDLAIPAGRPQEIAPRPFVFPMDSSFSDGPLGFFFATFPSLTSLGLTFR